MAQTTQRPAGQVAEGKRLSAAERRAARAAQLRLEQQQRQRQRLLFAAAGAIVLAIAAFFAIRAVQANQVGTRIADEGREHVNEGQAIEYKHYPPSSGTHYPTAQPAGIYREEVPEGKWVHSLEHGYIVVLLKCADGCPDTYRQLEDLYRNGLTPSQQFGTVKLVVTPYSHPYTDGEAPITVLGWQHEMKLQAFDRDKIIRFYNEYVDKGPELVP